MDRSYIVAFTIFPKGSGRFKTKFEVFSSKKMALNFYKSLCTENKCFYQQIKKEELEELWKKK